MEATKLKINLSEGTLEVEGSEGFVRAVYTDFKNKLSMSEKNGHNHKPQPLPKRSSPFGKREDKPGMDNVAHFTSKPLSVASVAFPAT